MYKPKFEKDIRCPLEYELEINEEINIDVRKISEKCPKMVLIIV